MPRNAKVTAKDGLSITERTARHERDKLTKEAHVLRGVLDLLTAEGIVHYRLNSGEVVVDGRRVRLCPPGTPDVLALWPDGPPPYRGKQEYRWGLRPLFIETKRPRGGTISGAQFREHARLRAAGAVVLVVDDVSQVQAMLRGPSR